MPWPAGVVPRNQRFPFHNALNVAALKLTVSSAGRNTRPAFLVSAVTHPEVSCSQPSTPLRAASGSPMGRLTKGRVGHPFERVIPCSRSSLIDDGFIGPTHVGKAVGDESNGDVARTGCTKAGSGRLTNA